MARLPKWVTRLGIMTAFLGVVLVTRTAPGTVAEQRERLPPPADCGEDAVGIWRAHVYSPRFKDWHVQTLHVRRAKDSETELVGTITAEVWDGGPEREQPGPCEGRIHYRVKMDAKGTIKQSGDIQFWGTTLEVDQVFCGRYFGYNKDNFSGTIDRELQEFQSVNNDGGRAVNSPTVFRRVRCFDPPPAKAKVKPPPIFPHDRRTGGCSCNTPGR